MNDVRLEFFENPAPAAVDEADYIRLLGFPRRFELEGRSRELADLARQWFTDHARPWIYARSASELEVNGKGIRIERATFSPARLRAQMHASGANQAVLVAVSAGAEPEQEAAIRWMDEKPDEYFFLEIYASAVVESLIARVSGRICAWADQEGMSALPHFSPGYSGWAVSEQPRLWRLLCQHGPRDLHERIQVLETGMLWPKKSQLAVIGLTRERERVEPGSTLVPCTSCSLPNCAFRRAPHRHFIRQIPGFSKTCA
jgi:hypothetical protein